MNSEEYLKYHSLNKEFVLQRGWELTDTKITIPIFDNDGKFIYNKYRHLVGETKFSFDPGNHPVLYCAEHIAKLKEVVLCEGEPDCIRLWQEGIPAVTGTGGVNTFTVNIANKLKDKTVYICLDTDKAGQGGIRKYVDVLISINAIPKIIQLPEEYKDVSEYLTDKHNKENFIKLKENSLSVEEWEKTIEPEDFKLEFGNELMEREIPPEEWLIDRVLPAEGFTFIVGAESTGKSFYTLTIAESVATGKPWLGKFNVGKQTNVLFIDKENSSRRKKARIAGLNIKDGLDKICWVMFPEKFSIANSNGALSDFALSLSKKVEQLKIGLIIIDSFADVMVGNENAASDVQQFFDAIRQLFPNKSILVLHHENKPSQGVARTSSQRVRGSTNITAQIVSGFRVFSLPKTTNEFVLEQFKAGDSEKLKPFKIELVSKPHPYKPDKTYVSEVKHNGEYYDQEGQAERAEELILELFDETPTNKRQDIIDYCINFGVSNGTVSRVISEMKKNNVLDTVKNGRYTDYILK